jgi:hypothetical protein
MLAPRFLLTVALAVAPLAGCKDGVTGGSRADGRFYGPSTAIGNGTVRTYVTIEDGRPAELGFALSEAALSGLPPQTVTLHLPFPAEAAGTQYTFAMFDWNPEGHLPAPIYSHPHFDFHFYLMEEKEVVKIGGGPDPVVPEASLVPEGYIAPGNPSVPAMGVHWMSASAPELNGHLFDKTMIYGFSGGRLIFIEPMITRAFLETKRDFDTAIAQPRRFAAPGLYPTRYGIAYDAQGREYRIAIKGFVQR